MDRAVQKTDDDATMSKYSAIIRKYYDDEYLPLFCARKPSPRLPLINIGTYCRVMGVDKLVNTFLETTKSCTKRAIVSLGAGSDTRAFHLLPKHDNLSYYELDFPVKTQQKQVIINKNEKLQTIIDKHGANYYLIGIDLRELSLKPELSTAPLASLQQLNHVPTLLLSECCLCYLQPDASDGVLHFFADLVGPDSLSMALYEPISLNDEFGRVMAENLATRGLSLPTINRYPTLESQIKRLHAIFNTKVEAVDIYTVYTEWLSSEERQRIARLEFLDEIEEMQLLMRHYCIAWTSHSCLV